MSRVLVQVDGDFEYLPSTHERLIDCDVECPSGKKPYFTFSAAKYAINCFKSRRDSYDAKGKYLEAYRCKDCARFHVGNKDSHSTRRKLAGY